MTCSWSPCSTRTTPPEAGDPKNFSAAFPQIPLHPASGCDTLNMCPAGFVIDLFLTHISLYGTPDQCVVRRPPGCRPRLEVGSGKARWRRPTWPFAGLPAAVRGWKLEVVKRAGGDPPGREGAGYNGSTRLLRGTLWNQKGAAQAAPFSACRPRGAGRIPDNLAGSRKFLLQNPSVSSIISKCVNSGFLGNLAPDYLRGLKHT